MQESRVVTSIVETLTDVQGQFHVCEAVQGVSSRLLKNSSLSH
jgi:hypothetical protein